MSKSHEISINHVNRVHHHDANAVTEHLAAGGDINATTPSSRNTFLHIAAEKNMLPLMSQLIERGIDIDAVNGAGLTALHQVTSQEAASLLLAAGANPFIRETTDSLNASDYHARRERQAAFQDGPGLAISVQIIPHIEALTAAVTQKSALYAVAGKALVDPHLIPDLANIAHAYNGYGKSGEITVQSLSANPEQEQNPERKLQLLMQQSVLQDVLTEITEEKKAASVATPSPSPAAASASSSPIEISAEISANAQMSAPSPQREDPEMRKALQQLMLAEFADHISRLQQEPPARQHAAGQHASASSLSWRERTSPSPSPLDRSSNTSPNSAER